MIALTVAVLGALDDLVEASGPARRSGDDELINVAHTLATIWIWNRAAIKFYGAGATPDNCRKVAAAIGDLVTESAKRRLDRPYGCHGSPVLEIATRVVHMSRERHSPPVVAT